MMEQTLSKLVEPRLTSDYLVRSDQIIVGHGKWTIREMVLNHKKIGELWVAFQNYPTLFSDLTRGKIANFTQALMSPTIMWYEIWEADKLIGIAWIENIEQIIDANVHLAFFDRKPAEKLEVVRQLLEYIFESYPFNRLTAMIPDLYHATGRLLTKLGFVHEGTKREALLIKGRWADVQVYGILRKEVI